MNKEPLDRVFNRATEYWLAFMVVTCTFLWEFTGSYLISIVWGLLLILAGWLVPFEPAPDNWKPRKRKGAK